MHGQRSSFSDPITTTFLGVYDQKVPGVTLSSPTGLTRNLFAHIKIAGQAHGGRERQLQVLFWSSTHFFILASTSYLDYY